LSLEPRALSQVAEEVSDDSAGGITDAGRLRFAARNPLGVELAQPPAGLGRLAQPLDEVGHLRRASEELERLLKLLLGRRAAVEVVVDGEDRRRARRIELALLLAGELEGVEDVDVRAPHRLLTGKEGGQADAEGLRSFQCKPLVYSHSSNPFKGHMG